jgi:hypothetical protein
MAFPFGGHPTFATYIEWLKQTHNGTAQTQITTDAAGKPHPATKLSLPNGNSVVVAGVGRTEYVAAGTISFIDRRLGVKSPWNIDP